MLNKEEFTIVCNALIHAVDGLDCEDELTDALTVLELAYGVVGEGPSDFDEDTVCEPCQADQLEETTANE